MRKISDSAAGGGPRRIAERALLLAIEGLARREAGESLDDFLDFELSRSGLRRVVSSLLFEYFRNKARIDFCAKALSRKPGGAAAPFVGRALRAALTRIFFQTGIARRVAVDVAVEVVKRRKGKFAAGFVNAALRRACGEGFMAEVERLMPEHVRAGLPEALFRKWRADFSGEEFENIRSSSLARAKFAFRTVRGAGDLSSIAAISKPVAAGFLSKFSFFTSDSPEKMLGSELFKSGKIYIQDPASALAGELIPDGDYKDILDICAAPGGKTVMLAELFPNASITAADRSAKRLERVRENIERFRLKNVKVIVADALKGEFRGESRDLVLADPPCSNTGVIRRRPDAMWSFSAKGLKELVKLQAEILDEAYRALKPGGVLVYSVCGVEKEEGSLQIESFLARHGDCELIKFAALSPAPDHDGGFAASLKKN